MEKPESIQDLLRPLTKFTDWASFLQSGTRNAFFSENGNVLALDLHPERAAALDLSPYALPALQWLDVSENEQLQTLKLPASLPELVHLDASRCALEQIEIPADAFSQQFLEEMPRTVPSLYLQKNKLHKVDFKGGCRGLELLDLSGNQLTRLTIPAGFARLKYLYLNDNLLEWLEFDTPLRHLRVLHLRNNKMKEETALPHNFLSLTALETLYLHGNDWQGNLASVIPGGERDNAFARVRDYKREAEKGTIENERVKIIIVGNGRVGKTSMFRRLKGLPFREDEPFTHGIQLGSLDKGNLPDVKTRKLQANVWDFGGQEIFYATHQFFLTDDALYLLAWTSEENVKPHRLQEKDSLAADEKWRPLDYWLENIRHHSKKSPLLMVQTHCDGQRTDINPLEYAGEPFRAKCLDFSAADDDGLKGLQRLITERLNNQIPPFGEKFPLTYDDVIGAIENIRHRNKITRVEFDAICKEANITPGAESSVLDFLRVTGMVVWFELVPSLKDTIFINPNWLTEQVYRLINKDLKQRKGRLDEDWARQHLPLFSAEERKQFLELLKNFELIFEAENEGPGIFIAPQYLPEALDYEAQVSFDKTKRRLAPAFIFRFPKFVPDNVMINFLSRYGPFSDKIYWKSGISFTSQDDTDCIVEFDEASRQLSVYAPGGTKSHYLQAEVCRAFTELSKNANAEISLDGTRFVSWQELLENKRDGVEDIRAIDKTPLKVSDFDRFFGKEGMRGETDFAPEPDNEVGEMPSVFFSYAWGDDQETGESREKIVDELYDSLTRDGFDVRRDKKSHEYGGYINDFMDKIGKGAVVVVFVSDRYLRSVYCMWELCEIYRNSLAEKEKFAERIIPVRVENLQLDKPKNLMEYLGYWKNFFEEWNEVVQKYPQEVGKPQLDAFEKSRTIKDRFGEVAGYFQNLNAKTNAFLRENDFAEVKRVILSRIENLRKNR